MQPIRSNKMTSDTTAVNLFYSSSLCEAVEIEKEYTVGFEFNIINWNAIPKACSNLDKEGVVLVRNDPTNKVWSMQQFLLWFALTLHVHQHEE